MSLDRGVEQQPVRGDTPPQDRGGREGEAPAEPVLRAVAARREPRPPDTATACEPGPSETAHSETDPAAAPHGLAEQPPEGCPPPLVWQQVVAAVRDESEAWELDRGGAVIRGRTFGQGPPLYFLNGLCGTQELFFLTLWLLRDEFRCVVFEYPHSSSARAAKPAGSARRDRSASRRDEAANVEDSLRESRRDSRSESPTVTGLAAMVEDLSAVADRHGDARFPVFATGFGGLVALAAMLERPRRIERAVIQAGYAHLRLSPVERLMVRVGRHVPGSLKKLPAWSRIQERNHRRWFPPFDHSRFEFFLENASETSIATMARRAALLRETDLRPRLAEINEPVLLVRAEGDGRAADECQRVLESGLPNARTESLHTCGRLPYLTHPHRLAKLLRDFLVV